jgi:MFS family permease
MDAVKTESRQRLRVAVALIVLTAVATASGVLPILRGSLQAHYGLSNVMFGFLVSFGSLAGAAGALVTGPLVDRRGPWFVFRLSLAGGAAGYAWGAVAGGLWLMVAALAAIYFFYYGMAIAAQAGLVALYPEGRRRVITAYLVGGALIGIAIPLIGEAQLRAVTAGRLSFATVLHGSFAFASLFLLAGLWWLRRQGALAPKAPAESKAGGPGGLAVSGLWVLVAIAVWHCCNDAVAYVWLPKILAGPSYVSQAILPGTVMALFSVGYLVSRLGLGLMPERKWRRRLLVAPGIAGGLVLLAGLLTRTQAGAAVGYVAGGLCWSLEYPVAVSVMAGDRRFGRAMGIFNVVQGVLCFVLPTALGGVVDGLQAAGRADRTWLVMTVPAVGFMLNGLLGWYWVRRHGRQLT